MKIIDKFNDSIGIFENALSIDFCNHLLGIFKEKEKSGGVHKGKMGGGHDFTGKHTTEMDLLYRDGDWYYDYIDDIRTLRDTSHLLAEKYTSQWFNPEMENGIEDPMRYGWGKMWIRKDNHFYGTWQIQKYEKGVGHYHMWHMDECPGGHSWYNRNTGKRSCDKNTPDCHRVDRMFVIMYYLNDVKEGGETQFLYSNYRIKPKAGTALIWPTTWPYVHSGGVPISNDKYIITSWLEYDWHGIINKIWNSKVESGGDIKKRTKPKPIKKGL